VLDNLLAFPTIDHQAERILVYIAEKHPTLVWDFFHRRLEIEPTDEGNYEAIPYQLHDLNKLLARDAVVAATGVRQWYVAGDHMFQYTGARLLHAVLPAFTAELGQGLVHVMEGRQATTTISPSRFCAIIAASHPLTPSSSSL
jgi:hypothetical protein